MVSIFAANALGFGLGPLLSGGIGVPRQQLLGGAWGLAATSD